MDVLITGGAGFIGTNLSLYLKNKGFNVTTFDNLSRLTAQKNSRYLDEAGIKIIKANMEDSLAVAKAAKGKDAIFHLAAQVAVTTSVADPRTDFNTNAIGSFNVMEAARAEKIPVIYTSTNKVYGDNVNAVPLSETSKRYDFSGKLQGIGISENFPIDANEHTPYGISKLVGDLYVRDYAAVYGLPTIVNRMSCIYGTKQYGNEDQGWVAHFAICAATGRKINIYGDGKQIRDVLFVQDLVELFESELDNAEKLAGNAFNVGGGPDKTLSLMELLGMLEKRYGVIETEVCGWRPADQKVYYSDIRKAARVVGWRPKTTPNEGVKSLCDWVDQNMSEIR
jgi:CDP-paratose 2-epimerase